MLTGRESLIRVVGKRRRILPNRCSIISASSSTSQNYSSLCQNDEFLKRDPTGKNDGGSRDVTESVSCPICGTRLPGLDNIAINCHLDQCLAKGSKRKLSQLTLFQLNFSKSKVRVHCSPSEDKPSDSNGSCKLDSSNELNISEVESKHHLIYSKSNASASCVENFIDKDNADNKLDSLSLPSQIDWHEYATKEYLDYCDISKVSIPTFIVGRRYGSREELHSESRVYLSRDPQNIKDSNAIKVLSALSECDNVLGYIPQELAQYLSPIIDKFNLNFEGTISLAPRNSSAAVPIQIVCNNLQLLDHIYTNNIDDFKSLWRDLLHIAKLAKSNSSGTTRYQHNLVMLIQDVVMNNSHLFTDSEISFLGKFTKLSDDSQRLFARLYTRKGPWFRISNISYSEIANCHEAIKELIELGYICSFPWGTELEDNSLEEVLNILNIDELREALQVLNKKYNYGMRKQDIVDLLVSSSKNMVSPQLEKFMLEVTGSCIRISSLADSLIWRAERLFFLNGEHDLSTFLLVDLGVVKYPAYKCIISEQVFSNRSDLLSYEEAIEISQIMVDSLDEDNSVLVLRCIETSASRMSAILGVGKSLGGGSNASFLCYFSPSWVYSKAVLVGVSFLERDKRYIDAIHLLKQLLDTFICDGRRGYWTLRLSVDLEHLGRVDESLQVAEDGLLDPWVRAGSKVALQRRVLRLGKPPRRWKTPTYSKFVQRKIVEVHIQGRPLNCKAGMKSIFYGEDGEQCGVEQLALQHYAGEGGRWQGVHSESGIWLTIFGILMWEIIFADMPNVFRSKYQSAPLDLETDSFYEVRKNLIEAHLDKIRDGMAEEILVTSWEAHVTAACRGVNWEKHSLCDLRGAVTCIGGPCLASICRHLAQDYRSWSSGMPDLLLWRFHDCYRGEAKLVEVKGPRDRLSEQQRAWLLVLINCGFNVEICKVTPAPVKLEQ